MKRFILCVVVGTLVAQVWGMISWMALNWHCWDFRQFSDDTPVAEAISAQAQEGGTGIYMLPNFDPTVAGDENKMKEWFSGAASGPYAFMVLRPGGVDANMGRSMGLGFLLNALIAAVLFWILGNLSATGHKQRSLILGVVGSLGGLYVHFNNWNHWHFPISYSAIGILDLFITWALAGCAMILLSDKLQKA